MVDSNKPQTHSAPLLEVDIRKHYDSFNLDMNFSLERAHVVGLLGASGCGKSQTLRALAGIMTPDLGSIRLHGTTLFDSEHHINVPPQKRDVGYLFQNYQIFKTMSVKSNIFCGMPKTWNTREKQQEYERLVELFQLSSYINTPTALLSGGQQQRLALARMIASRPKLMLFDEPFSALDENLKADLYPQMAQLLKNFNCLVLYVSHDLNESVTMCQEILVCEHGAITDKGQTQRIVRKPQSRAALKLAQISNISPCSVVNTSEIYAQYWSMKLAASITCSLPRQQQAYVGIHPKDIVVLASAHNPAELYDVSVQHENSCIAQVKAQLNGLMSSTVSCVILNTAHTINIQVTAGVFCSGEYICIKFPQNALHVVYS